MTTTTPTREERLERLQLIVIRAITDPDMELAVRGINRLRLLFLLLDPQPGECRYCGCTELSPCGIQTPRSPTATTCAWADEERTICSNIRCLALAAVEDAPIESTVPLDEQQRIVIPDADWSPRDLRVRT